MQLIRGTHETPTGWIRARGGSKLQQSDLTALPAIAAT
jgi:hypothetical protein